VTVENLRPTPRSGFGWKMRPASVKKGVAKRSRVNSSDARLRNTWAGRRSCKTCVVELLEAEIEICVFCKLDLDAGRPTP